MRSRSPSWLSSSTASRSRFRRAGTIYDREGVELALGERALTVYADPRQVRTRRVAGEAARLLGVDSAKLITELADRRRHFVYVQRKADPERARRLLALRLAGVDAYPEERRVYPQGRRRARPRLRRRR